MIQVAIIGTGAIARSHIEAYLKFPERCEIIAVADVYPQKAINIVSEFGLTAKVYEDYHVLLDHAELNLVSVCTPPYTHAEIAIDFLRAHKHVLVEKPMASSLAECDAMIAAAKANHRILSVVAQNRFRTEMMKLKQTLDEGIIGKILHAQIDSYWWRGHSYYDLWWRGTWAQEGGGCTLNHAVHHMDALLWMMGMPSEVQALMSNVAHDNAEVEDISITALRFANGSLGQITSSVVHHGEEQQLIFQGEKARVSMPWKLFASRTKENGFPNRDRETERAIQALYDQLPDVAYEGHTGQIDNVLTALEQHTPVLIDGHEGRNTLELITAIYKSASTKSPVTLPLQEDDPFYTKKGIEQNATHFYEKSKSVQAFQDNSITT